MKLDFYGILDYPAQRKVLWNLDDIRRVINVPKLALSTVIVRRVPELVGDFLSSWIAVGSRQFVEEAVLLGERILRGEEREPRLAILRLLSKAKFKLTDLLMFNKYLKLLTGLALPDYGLVVTYANPIRPGDELANLPRVLTRIRAEPEPSYGSSEAAVSLNAGRNTVVDWSNMGVLPYSPYSTASNNLADPVLVLFRAGYRISTSVDSSEVVLVGGTTECEAVCDRALLILPQGLKEARSACSYSVVDQVVEYCRTPL